MGNERVTVQNLTVVRSDPEKNVIIVKGAVPGNKGSLLIIKDSVKV
jgi:large subunit ribosomal protein L3